MAVRYVTTNVRFDPRDYADLQRLAAARGDSLAECVRLAVSAYLGHPDQPQAAEAAAQYTLAGEEEPEIPAVVHGQTLVLERPLSQFRDGARVWVHCRPESQVLDRRRHRRVLVELLEEFEGLRPGKPGPVSDDDRELYRP